MDEGANRIPEGAQELRGALWLGCTNENEIRGNAGFNPPGAAHVYPTLVESVRVSLDGSTTGAGRRILCVPQKKPFCD